MLSLLLCAAMLAAPAGSPAVGSATAASVLTFNEEFSGDRLDLKRWTYRATGPRHDGVLTPDAVSVGGGALTIKTYSEGGTHYSGMISTEKPVLALLGSAGFEQTYGIFEARVKFSSSPGMWSAFWLQTPTNGLLVGQPGLSGVEMDIAEHRARCVTAPAEATPPAVCDNDISDRIQQALIWDGYGADSKSAVKLSDPLAGLGNGSWHIWTLRWTPNDLTWYYDGTPIASSTGPISQRNQFIVLSSEIWQSFAGQIPPGGYGSRQTSITNVQVDYVRVWSLP